MSTTRGALGTMKALDLMGRADRGERPLAVCPRDGAPLISTMAFPKADFYCLECGAHLDFLAPGMGKPTKRLAERYERLKAQWDEHAGRNLLTPRAWYKDCERCEGLGEYHEQHATDEEREADRVAREWLRQRVARSRVRKGSS